MKPQVVKGVPSLINEFKLMYRNSPDKAAIVGEVLHSFNDSMEKELTLEPNDEEE